MAVEQGKGEFGPLMRAKGVRWGSRRLSASWSKSFRFTADSPTSRCYRIVIRKPSSSITIRPVWGWRSCSFSLEPLPRCATRWHFVRGERLSLKNRGVRVDGK